MNTVLIEVVNVRVGDRVVLGSDAVAEVIAASSRPATIGGCLLHQAGDAAMVGDRYSIIIRKSDGTETGCSGRYDGKTYMRVLVADRRA